MPAEVDVTLVEQRILEQSLRLPVTGAVTGWASLRLAGAGFFDGLDRDGHSLLPVPLAVGVRQIRAGDGIAVSRERLWAEMPVSSSERSERVEMAEQNASPRATM